MSEYIVLNKCQKQVNINNSITVEQLGKAVFDYYQSSCIKEYRNLVNDLYTLFEKASSNNNFTLTPYDDSRISLLKKINDMVRYNLELFVNAMRKNPVLKSGLIPDPYIPSVEAEERKGKRNSINSNLKLIDSLKILHFRSNQILTYFKEKRIINYEVYPLKPEKKNVVDLVQSIGRTNYGGICRTKRRNKKSKKTRKNRKNRRKMR